MSIFNPWGELRALKQRLAAEEAAYVTEETEQQKLMESMKRTIRDMEVQLRAATMERDMAITRMKSMHARDPKTGRILPKGK